MNDEITIDNFKGVFKNVLRELNFNTNKIDTFINNECRLQDIGVCISLCIIIDDNIKKIFPNYDGCFPKETIDIIWEWNKDLINNKNIN